MPRLKVTRGNRGLKRAGVPGATVQCPELGSGRGMVPGRTVGKVLLLLPVAVLSGVCITWLGIGLQYCTSAALIATCAATGHFGFVLSPRVASAFSHSSAFPDNCHDLCSHYNDLPKSSLVSLSVFR